MKKEMVNELIVYFIMGGMISAATAYAASKGGGIAALVTIVPLFTALAFISVFRQGGPGIIYEYAMGLVVYNFAWCAFVIGAGYFAWKWGDIWWALGIGTICFVVIYILIELYYKIKP